MYSLWEEIGDAREGGFDALAVVVFEEGHVGLIGPFAVCFAAAMQLDLVTFCQQIFYLIAVVTGIVVELAPSRQFQGHGLKSGNVNKGAGIDTELDGQPFSSGNNLDAEAVKVARLLTHFLR